MRPLGGVAAAGLALAVLAACTAGSNGGGAPTSASSSAAATVTATTTITAPGTTASAGTATSATAKASGPGLCTPTVATFSIGPSMGAAGTTYFPIHVTNASQQPCVTTGYPGIALLDAGGSQIVQATRQTSGTTPVTITLAPGEEATAVVLAETTDPGGATCPISPKFLFTLPDNTDSTTLTHATPICAVQVRPFVKGDGGT